MSNGFEWTQSQLDSITAKADKILVSAAAGSGKSTVLTERIIRSVTDIESKTDLDDIMVVTFTRASADDLKDKITEALRKACEADPKNTHLSNQLTKLPSAKINTIHGICFSLIKRNFSKLGLPASVTIGDDTVMKAMKLDVMEKLLDYCYEGMFKPIPDFADFAENFINGEEDDLKKLLFSMYDSILNHPHGIKTDILPEYLNENETFISTHYGKLILNRLCFMVDYYISVLNAGINYFMESPDFAPLIDQFYEEIEYYRNIKKSVENDAPTSLLKAMENKPTGKVVKISTKLSTPTLKYYRDERNAFRKQIDVFISELFPENREGFKEDALKTEKYAIQLILLLKEYDRRYSDAKLERSYLDFSDLERKTLELLYEDDGSFSQEAYDISSSLKEIYVDEYQDLNPIQNKIFSALSVKCPIFMVGDIKQSIYGFRGADPSAFSAYKKAFPEYKSGVAAKSATVFLSHNFRSAKTVTEFANIVSDALFTNDRAESIYDYRIPYSASDRLICGKKSTEKELPVSVVICHKDKNDEQIKRKGTYYLEAEAVANEVSSLISSGNACPRDIALLMRTNTVSEVFEQALKRRGVPVATSSATKLFDTPEVQLALCILNCCDNPYRDVYLAGAMKSPIFGFTLDEMVQIRTISKDLPSLYDALLFYTETENFEKGRNFLDMMERLRRFSSENTVDSLLWQIYSETSFFSVIYDGGAASEALALSRRSNLIMLHELAQKYCASSQGTLFGFLDKIRILIEQNASPAASVTADDGVRILTLHSSKGLEFPYCFICATTYEINRDDLSANTVFDLNNGLAMRLRDQSNFTSYSTPYRSAVIYQIEQKLYDEEMRLLYVALTRAKKKLYVYASTANYESLEQKADYSSRLDHPYAFMCQKCHFSWILTALKMNNKETECYELIHKTQEEILEHTVFSDTDGKKAEKHAEISEEEIKELRNIFEFKYPYQSSIDIPSKFSVSKLYPEILDESEYFGNETVIFEDEHDEKERVNSTLYVPYFMLDGQKAGSAEKGTATHVFMQFCDLQNLSKAILENEINRLVEKRFILPQHAALIDRKAIKRFISSPTYEMIKNAAEVVREYRFNIKLQASDFTANEALKSDLKDELIFVQGIIDCYIRDKNGQLILLDYKTDRVPSNIMGNEIAENEFFIKRHSLQLEYYRKALEILTKQTVYKTLIYSFALGRCIEIN